MCLLQSCNERNSNRFLPYHDVHQSDRNRLSKKLKNNMEQGLGSIHQVVDWMEGDLNVSI